jgi:hypothetical protein
MNISFAKKKLMFSGPGGSLPVPEDDEISRRLAMLIQGECEGQGATPAAQKFKFSRQRSVERIIADYGLQKKTLRP